ncbi:hypothetical protein OPV22_014537 [Ensete ventricosum]|uniref:Uncharacterized protein n=1 Tax=Ensete ventricosum TaxID=4639 RepID=A0AAV8R698_ENSVE|nr:hypothetical protein OPV22_014537 [Ensete ventricosum]
MKRRSVDGSDDRGGYAVVAQKNKRQRSIGGGVEAVAELWEDVVLEVLKRADAGNGGVREPPVALPTRRPPQREETRPRSIGQLQSLRRRRFAHHGPRVREITGLASLDVPPAQTSEGSISTPIPAQFFDKEGSHSCIRVLQRASSSIRDVEWQASSTACCCQAKAPREE